MAHRPDEFRRAPIAKSPDAQCFGCPSFVSAARTDPGPNAGAFSTDCFRSRRGFQLHDLDVPIAGTSGEFEPLLIEDPDDAASVAYQLAAL
jgi:hypothetical protein